MRNIHDQRSLAPIRLRDAGLLAQLVASERRSPSEGLARSLAEKPVGGHQNGHMSFIVRSVRHAIAPLTRTRPFRRIAPVALPPLERGLRLVSCGRLQVSGLLVPSLVLHSIGARTGIERDTSLMYTPDGAGNAIVAATSFAREKHPAWSYNLMANPNAAITVRGHRQQVRATLLTKEERESMWRRIEQQWPGYRSYERESGRTVRLFRLEPLRENESTDSSKPTRIP